MSALVLADGGAQVIGIHLPYDGRTLKWSDNVPESGGTYALLKLRTVDGLEGVGEATLKPIWTGASLRSLRASMEDVLLPRLAGIDLADVEAVRTALAAVPENMVGKTMIDNACWDLRSQAAGVPLWKLLGGRQDVDLSWTLTRAAPESMIDEAVQAVARHGFKTIKMKGGQGIDVDARAVLGIREACAARGTPVMLYVDANWQYPVSEGPAYAQAMADVGAALVEDPWWLQPDDVFERASASMPVPIMVDYFCSGPRDAPTWLARGARAFSVKPGRIGITEGLDMVRLAGPRQADIVVGMFAETPIGTLATLSFAAACQSRFAAESSFYLVFGDTLLKQPLAVRDGKVTLPDTSGVARLVDWDRVSRYMVAP